ncbi:hypothetical protein [Bartonella sp. AU18XJBT]|uniref:hypothetical protein n=1 Tax=Bartonella sp. AU18XJBT TaxID=3019089 RepID=UPI002362E8CA|nr:hypothetical protein [Bartonella sp. AU18XJBT]
MDIRIRVYTNKYKLSDSFHSSSGVLVEKTELIILFTVRDKVISPFAMELPLSPSHGEMPDDFIKSVNERSINKSKHFSNSLSYFFGLEDFFKKVEMAKIINSGLIKSIKTIGIGEIIDDEIRNYDLIKLKSSNQYLDDTIAIVNENKNVKFIIDFNASINFEQWNYFIDRIDKNNLFGIEQPMKFPSKIPDLGFLNIADETFVKCGYEKIHEYGYNAFVYKPFASNIKELYKCFENKNNYVGMVGSNVSGPLDCSFCNIINHYMPTKLAGNRASNFEAHPLNNKTEDLMRIREKKIYLSDEFFIYLDKFCRKVSDLYFDMNTLKEIATNI